ncbi:MAG: trypsin-like serine protease [Acidobacteriota bacterium]
MSIFKTAVRPSALVRILLAGLVCGLFAAAPGLSDAGHLLTPKPEPEVQAPVSGDAEAPRILFPQRIVNGVATWDLPSLVSILVVGGNQNLVTNCSGTLIGCDTVLSAAHCFFGFPNPGSYLVYGQNTGLNAVSSITIHPDYPGFVGSQADVAILRLAEPVTGVAPMPINTAAKPSPGTPALIAGYGLTQGGSGDAGIKRAGLVQTETCTVVPDGPHLCWEFANPIGPVGTDSNTCPGDSGGPLFVDTGTELQVAGITSGGINANCLPTDNSFDADVFTYRNWIQANSGPGFGANACGVTAQAGEEGGTILAGGGTLGDSNPSDSFVFDVPEGTAVVRVVLNAADGSSSNPTDYDLYVKQGGVPTTTDWDCRPFLFGPYEGCEVSNPIPGQWGVLVNRFTGSAEYQVSTTLLAGEPAGGCVESGTTMCLGNGRFAVSATYRTAAGGVVENANTVQLTNDTGYFWFFGRDNLEAFVKVLDACGANQRYWVFAGGLTDLEVVVTVEDTQTGQVNTYTNPSGSAYQTVNDTDAFASCP